MDDEIDPFAPPPSSVLVGCIHCARVFMSDEMSQRDDDEDGLWWCKFPDCSGRGYGMDIWKLGTRFTKESFEEYFGGPPQVVRPVKAVKAVKGRRVRRGFKFVFDNGTIIEVWGHKDSDSAFRSVKRDWMADCREGRRSLRWGSMKLLRCFETVRGV